MNNTFHTNQTGVSLVVIKPVHPVHVSNVHYKWFIKSNLLGVINVNMQKRCFT